MTAWPDEIMVGTDLDTDFQTINDLLETADAVDLDPVFEDFSDYRDRLDGGESGVGFPAASLKWAGREDINIEPLKELIPGQSAELYWRLPTNRVDTSTGKRIWRTFLTQTLWAHGEDKQAGVTLGFELRLRRLRVQVEAT